MKTPFIILLLLMLISAKIVDNNSNKTIKIEIGITVHKITFFRFLWLISLEEDKIIFSASCNILSSSSETSTFSFSLRFFIPFISIFSISYINYKI